jgi:hypothetical protein
LMCSPLPGTPSLYRGEGCTLAPSPRHQGRRHGGGKGRRRLGWGQPSRPQKP